MSAILIIAQGQTMCIQDAKLCPDGVTWVNRNPDNNCDFFPCEEETTVCTEDVKLCPDGFTDVSRDPENDCDYFPCPKSNDDATATVCTTDVRLCSDGSYVSRDPDNNCDFFACKDADQWSVFRMVWSLTITVSEYLGNILS